MRAPTSATMAERIWVAATTGGHFTFQQVDGQLGLNSEIPDRDRGDAGRGPGPRRAHFSRSAAARAELATKDGCVLAVAGAADVGVAGVGGGTGRGEGESEREGDGQDLENTTERHSVVLPTPPAISSPGPPRTICGMTAEVKRVLPRAGRL